MTLQVQIEDAMEVLNQNHAELMKELTGDSTVEERDTWSAKEAAALAASKGEADQFQLEMLGAEADIVGEEVPELITKILTNAAGFKKLIGVAAGIRRAGLKALSACQSEAEITATLMAVEAQANAAKAMMQGGA